MSSGLVGVELTIEDDGLIFLVGLMKLANELGRNLRNKTVQGTTLDTYRYVGTIMCCKYQYYKQPSVM